MLRSVVAGFATFQVAHSGADEPEWWAQSALSWMLVCL